MLTHAAPGAQLASVVHDWQTAPPLVQKQAPDVVVTHKQFVPQDGGLVPPIT